MIGGKARALLDLRRAGFRVPAFFIIGPDERLDEQTMRRRCDRLARGAKSATFAVRSSAQAEDGLTASYAGMFETFLFVTATQVANRARQVRDCGSARRVRIYDSLRGQLPDHKPAVIVQLMVDADVSGVAFGRDPVNGSDRAVVSATYGLGSGVVNGDCDADTFHITRDGDIIERHIGHKTTAHRQADAISGVETVAVEAHRADAPALGDGDILQIAEQLRRIESLFGSAQDVEWAISRGELYLLQARPITTQTTTIWDNSNIAESYGGLVSPLTYSFARYAYAAAYRQLMRVFSIDPKRIDAHRDTVENLLGLVRGRMYYHLLNWYRLLALVPGFALNRRFMEGMMGVREPLPPHVLQEIEHRGKARDAVGVTKMLFALLYRYVRLGHDVRRFHRRVASALAVSPPLANLDPSGLLAEFSRLEDALLNNWDAPLVNDFFAMVFYGALRAFASRWCGDEDGSLHNDLLCSAGGMVSTEPARLIEEMANVAGSDDALLAAIDTGDPDTAVAAIRTRSLMFEAYTQYLDRFGDRCPNELKLESLTLHHDPRPLLMSIARMARRSGPKAKAEDVASSIRRTGEAIASQALRRNALRAMLFSFVLAQARNRVRDRENLRLERTRVFARVREIMLEIGRRLHERGALVQARDVFLLELPELRDAVDRPASCVELRKRVEERRALYANYQCLPAPPDRFAAAAELPQHKLEAMDPADPSTRAGIGCCHGTVRARVRVVKDANAPLQFGEILVAERTDPGWIVLFPAAAGILVERGSVLSHAAIVSREMGIPSVVGLAGLTSWLKDGDLVELDGASGVVRRLEPATFRSPTDAQSQRPA